MTARERSAIDAIRQPEYTGENRCMACTVVNVIIALLLSAVLALLAVELAVVVFLGALAAIYLRGYLVPGTPTLTKRYLPERVLAAFDGHEPIDGGGNEESFETLEELEREREQAVEPEVFLADVGAIESCDGGADVCLTEAFSTAVQDRLETEPDPDSALRIVADLFEEDPETVAHLDRSYPAFEVGSRVRKWPSEGALVLDLATHAALSDWADEWATVPIGQRVGILKSLRSFHDTCPTCGGDLAFAEEIVESCCTSHAVVAYTCTDCGARLLELDPTALEEGAENKGISA